MYHDLITTLLLKFKAIWSTIRYGIEIPAVSIRARGDRPLIASEPRIALNYINVPRGDRHVIA